MNYEKKYKEANHKIAVRLGTNVAKEIFPDLYESEDEKISNEIIKFLELPHPQFVGKRHQEKWVAWLEKQGEQKYTKKDVDDAYLKGISDTKNEIEKQYEATCQIRRDIATFILNYRGDIKDRAKWIDYLGIRVSLVQDKQKSADKEPRFKVGDTIIPKDRGHEPWQIMQVDKLDKKYRFKDGYVIHFSQENNYELAEQKSTNNRLVPRKGEYYVCIEDYYLADGEITNTKGQVYKSSCDGYINDNRGFGLSWKNSCIEKYFSPVKDEDWIICCKNDNVIGKSIQYKTLKSNKVLQKAIKKLENNGFVIKLRLWTISDAKPGDVLRVRNLTFIFQEITNNNVCHKDAVVAYCSYEDNDDSFGVCGPDCITDLEIITPATEEQRDLLFQKIKESGYEWNAEKKELKKIEQKTAWSEEDEYLLDETITHLEALIRITKKLGSAYSDEIQYYQRDIYWLKTLKERCTWKPSDEQMKALNNVYLNGGISYAGQGQELINLYNDLKKLRG